MQVFFHIVHHKKGLDALEEFGWTCTGCLADPAAQEAMRLLHLHGNNMSTDGCGQNVHPSRDSFNLYCPHVTRLF